MAAENMSVSDAQAPGLADQDVDSSLPKIKIGICAMDKKAKSKPMKAILERLLAFGEFETELFGDDNILNYPVSQWPTCDCLLSWHSEGFPLKKVTNYIAALGFSYSKQQMESRWYCCRLSNMQRCESHTLSTTCSCKTSCWTGERSISSFR